MTDNNEPNLLNTKEEPCDSGSSIREKVEKFYDGKVTKPLPSGDLQVDSKNMHEYQLKVVMYLAALGVPLSTINRKTGIAKSSIHALLKNPKMQVEIEKIQRDLFLKDPQKWFDYILKDAIEVSYRMMKSKKVKDSVKADIAFKFMDRALGKPKQEIETTNNIMKSVIVELDNRKRKTVENDEIVVNTEGKEIQVTSSSQEEKKDKIDTIAEDALRSI